MPIKILFIILFGFAGTYFYLLFDGVKYITPYVFQQQQKVTAQAFVDYLMTRFFYLLVMIGFTFFVDSFFPIFKHEFRFIVLLFGIYILDYWLFYHNPVAKIAGIPISYPLVMGLTIFVIFIESIIKWYSLKP